jgi:hypothetical protein
VSGSIAERGRLTAQIGLVVAVALGVLLLEACSSDDGSSPPLPTGGVTDESANGGDGSTPGAGTDGSTTAPATTDPTTTESTATTTTVPPTTTTTLAIVTNGAIVKVANAAGVPGAAGRFTQILEGLGYPVENPTDAAGYEIRLDVSKVYFAPEAEKAAKRMARLMGVEAFPMPTPVPILEANAALGDSTIVVMLGQDLADEPNPGFTYR